MQEPTCKEDAQFQNYYLNNYGNRSELQVYCKLKENTYAKNGFYPTVSSAELLQRPLLENKQKKPNNHSLQYDRAYSSSAQKSSSSDFHLITFENNKSFMYCKRHIYNLKISCLHWMTKDYIKITISFCVVFCCVSLVLLCSRECVKYMAKASENQHSETCDETFNFSLELHSLVCSHIAVGILTILYELMQKRTSNCLKKKIH